jgi:hypothetical protein
MAPAQRATRLAEILQQHSLEQGESTAKLRCVCVCVCVCFGGGGGRE